LWPQNSQKLSKHQNQQLAQDSRALLGKVGIAAKPLQINEGEKDQPYHEQAGLYNRNIFIFTEGKEVWPCFFQAVNSPFILPKKNGVSLDEITFSQIFKCWEPFQAISPPKRDFSSSGLREAVGII
jgi:hypothetical protein